MNIVCCQICALVSAKECETVSPVPHHQQIGARALDKLQAANLAVRDQSGPPILLVHCAFLVEPVQTMSVLYMSAVSLRGIRSNHEKCRKKCR